MSIFTYEKLCQAYFECRRTKRKTINALKFELEWEENLSRLLKELQNRTYYPGRSICFVVTEPVPREVFAADFRDRIVHHLLIREIIEKGERIFIYDSFACRPGKGTHRAVKRLRKFIRQITANNRQKAFYIKLDIKGFFMSIDQRILFRLVEKLVAKLQRERQWAEEMLWLARTIIFHRPQENYLVKGNPNLFSLIPAHKSLFAQKPFRGLPIGNYTSQFFANLYLNELDHFVKRVLQARYYLRYVDDFIILDYNPKQLLFYQEEIDKFLRRNLNLSLSRKKTKLQALDKGIDFIGYFIKPEAVLVRQKVVRRLKNKIWQINKNNSFEKRELIKILAQINSYFGHFNHAHSFALKNDIFNNHLKKLRPCFIFNKNQTFLKLP